LKTDLHLHTCDGSRETYIRYDACRLIDAAMEKGYDVISITNHDTVTYSDYLQDYARERGIVLIPGMEITLQGRHVLSYHSTRSPVPVSSFAELQKNKSPDTLYMAPHPFYPGGCSLGRRFLQWGRLFDAVELSHFYTNAINFNRKAIDAAESLNLPLVGTSDSHTLRQLNTTYSLVYAEKTAEAVLAAVKSGRVDIVTAPLSVCDLAMIVQEMLFSSSVKKAGAACVALLSLLTRS